MKKNKASIEKSRTKKSSVGFSLRGYEGFLKDLKGRIRSAQIKAALSVNRELIMLYWQIGCDILIIAAFKWVNRLPSH